MDINDDVAETFRRSPYGIVFFTMTIAILIGGFVVEVIWHFRIKSFKPVKHKPVKSYQDKEIDNHHAKQDIFRLESKIKVLSEDVKSIKDSIAKIADRMEK